METLEMPLIAATDILSLTNCSHQGKVSTVLTDQLYVFLYDFWLLNKQGSTAL